MNSTYIRYIIVYARSHATLYANYHRLYLFTQSKIVESIEMEIVPVAPEFGGWRLWTLCPTVCQWHPLPARPTEGRVTAKWQHSAVPAMTFSALKENRKSITLELDGKADLTSTVGKRQ